MGREEYFRPSNTDFQRTCPYPEDVRKDKPAPALCRAPV